MLLPPESNKRHNKNNRRYEQERYENRLHSDAHAEPVAVYRSWRRREAWIFGGGDAAVTDTPQLNRAAEPTTFYWAKYFRANPIAEAQGLIKPAGGASPGSSGSKSRSVKAPGANPRAELSALMNWKPKAGPHALAGAFNGTGFER